MRASPHRLYQPPQPYTMASNEVANTNQKRPGLPHRTSNLRFEVDTPSTPTDEMEKLGSTDQMRPGLPRRTSNLRYETDTTPSVPERPSLFRRISSFRNDAVTPPATPKRPTLEHRSSSFKKAVGGVKGFFAKDASSVITIEGMSEYLGSMTPPASVPGTPISVAEDRGGYFDLSTVNKALEELQSATDNSKELTQMKEFASKLESAKPISQSLLSNAMMARDKGEVDTSFELCGQILRMTDIETNTRIFTLFVRSTQAPNHHVALGCITRAERLINAHKVKNPELKRLTGTAKYYRLRIAKRYDEDNNSEYASSESRFGLGMMADGNSAEHQVGMWVAGAP
ncbi:hypothetical protein LTR56_022843 [Elasticomyces elasticus]|nr:hypothetical protein LTR56_022843 [Elasticomyces elasticus]KAK3627463.1 hypothetical protein LTR22_022739 [Elasticomyces elasticus]KAK4907622.1 hypothetical protein LTR49_023375 [Elasticomyces elasticus]KAK5743019.1 hypothetical protein LTS12_024012 [Elasticomyces elasticus]